jgi:hypothetical protein
MGLTWIRHAEKHVVPDDLDAASRLVHLTAMDGGNAKGL